MGQGYWILIWDDWGSGLDMINPRFLEDGRYFSSGGARWSLDYIAERHDLSQFDHWRVIRSESYVEDADPQYVREWLGSFSDKNSREGGNDA